MFFWMVLLTFFSSLLIYALYPRNDGITIEDKPLANIAVSDLLTQHLAAVDAAEVLSTSSGSRKKAYVQWVETANKDEAYKVLDDNMEDFFPGGYLFSEIEDQWPVTKIYCIQNKGQRLTKNCGVTSGTFSTTDFIVTYIKKTPAEFGLYIAKLAPRSLGEKMFLTEYVSDSDKDEGTRAFDGYSLKTNCGIVRQGVNKNAWPTSIRDFDPEGIKVLDNTRYYTVRVPAAVSLPTGSLACITRLSATYTPDINNNLRIVYPSEE